MRVINARNVNDAWPQALSLLLNPSARVAPSRNGSVRMWHEPVTTVYARPCERVLLDPVRNAPVWFHFFEAIWMLAGRNDVKWLDQFVGDFSQRFGEPDGTEHDAYGHRWRNYFGFDQLDACVDKLKNDYDDRQAVIQIWDAGQWPQGPGGQYSKGCDGADDLLGKWRTRPCNTHVYLRVRDAMPSQRQVSRDQETGEWPKVLDLTVLCRSNDVAWGAYGANCVHFSVLAEYLAARIGGGVGTMYQVSNNWHLYESALPLVDLKGAERSADRPYPGCVPMVTVPEAFDEDLRVFMDWTASDLNLTVANAAFKNEWFRTTAVPMFMSNVRRREKDYARALDWAKHVAAPDWRVAATEWLQRRVDRKREAA